MEQRNRSHAFGMGADFHISIRVGEVGVEGLAHLHKVCEVTTESSKRIHTQG